LTDSGQSKAMNEPDMSRQVLTSAKNHAAFAVTSALEGFGRCWPITFVDACGRAAQVGDMTMSY